MSANEPTQAPGSVDIAGALGWARTRIELMDARVLLRFVLQCPAARLVAWPEQRLDGEDWSAYRALVERRMAGEPVAYLTGEREFFGREFMVTPAVLIPRPDTELLVELALAHFAGRKDMRVLDMGTGSGALAVTLALELDDADVIALDRSREALWVAMANAARLGASSKPQAQGEKQCNLAEHHVISCRAVVSSWNVRTAFARIERAFRPVGPAVPNCVNDRTKRSRPAWLRLNMAV